MTTECKMAEALMEAWAAFTISPAQFRRIADDLAATVDDGLAGRPSAADAARLCRQAARR